MKCYVISVSLGTGCYRHIQIRAHATLNRLSKAILSAFDFEDDHAHAFFMDNHVWSPGDAYYSMKMRPSDCLTTHARLEDFGFQKGASFKYLFDFGDEWVFQCKFLREVDDPSEIPHVIRSMGESPEQYPQSDDWDEDEDWDEDDEDDLFLPEEKIQEMFEMLPLEDKEIQNLKSYFRAGARLYGIVTLEKLLEIYNSQNPPIDETLFLMTAKIFSLQEDSFFVVEQEPPRGKQPDPWQAEVVCEDLFMAGLEYYHEMQNMQKGKEYCILPKAEFLRYAEEDYFPVTPASTKLKKFLKQNLPAEEAIESWKAIQGMVSLGCELKDVLEALTMYTSLFERKVDIAELAAIFQELNNTSRMMPNRGYTPNEMAQLYPRTVREKRAVPMDGQTTLFGQESFKGTGNMTVIGKLEPNAKCPCGSGRKYKNCCGKGK